MISAGSNLTILDCSTWDVIESIKFNSDITSLSYMEELGSTAIGFKEFMSGQSAHRCLAVRRSITEPSVTYVNGDLMWQNHQYIPVA